MKPKKCVVDVETSPDFTSDWRWAEFSYLCELILQFCALKGHFCCSIQRQFHVGALCLAGVVRTAVATEDGACFLRWEETGPFPNNLPDPKSQRRTGPDNLTTFTTLSCTMQTVYFMNCRLYLNLVQHLSVICLDMQRSVRTRGFV